MPEDLSQLLISSMLLILSPTLSNAFFANSFFVAIATPVAATAPPVATVANATFRLFLAASESLMSLIIPSRFLIFIPKLLESAFNSLVLNDSRLPLLSFNADIISGEIFMCSGI